MDKGLGWRKWHVHMGPGVRLCNLVAQSSEMPKEQFKREVEKELKGKDTEPWEIIYFQSSTRASFPSSSKLSKQQR